MTDAERTGADRALNGRRNLCVGQVQRRLRLDRPGAIELRHRLGAFGGEDVDLALRRQQTRLAVLELGDFFAQRRVGLLGALDGARAGLHQAVVADLFFLRELQIGFGSSDVGRALLDDRLLQSNLRFEIAHCGFRCDDIGMRLIERRLEIAIVDPGQQLAGLDRLVVADQHLRDVAGDFW